MKLIGVLLLPWISAQAFTTPMRFRSLRSTRSTQSKVNFCTLNGLRVKDTTALRSTPSQLIAPPSYKLGLTFLAPSLVLSAVSLVFFPVLLFSVFLLIQTARVRFVFDETSFSLQNAKPFSDELESSGENFVVGGENRWSYDSFVNYDFFPQSFPILVYFKETQTPEEKWGEGPGSLDKVGGGQLHFFPAIVDTDCLKEEFAKRGCAKK